MCKVFKSFYFRGLEQSLKTIAMKIVENNDPLHCNALSCDYFSRFIIMKVNFGKQDLAKSQFKMVLKVPFEMRHFEIHNH